jgi:hypothetical protein
VSPVSSFPSFFQGQPSIMREETTMPVPRKKLALIILQLLTLQLLALLSNQQITYAAFLLLAAQAAMGATPASEERWGAAAARC